MLVRLDFKNKKPTAFVFTHPLVLSGKGIAGGSPKRGLSQFPLLAEQTFTLVIAMPGKYARSTTGAGVGWRLFFHQKIVTL
ncbi:MAG: hypothetical protein HS127_01620 [Planctomycetia bacterium]|jgi:hypothetical protein|nr:hypothetical protein [Candidatus Kuenenia stuttgartiensis]MBE7545852.1 hypothetical protein [Planctomycetia bacterium]TVM01787.1 MAG: hypothetical protein CV080_03340 [Candidatus Kuenenia stuttgartiensis]